MDASRLASAPSDLQDKSDEMLTCHKSTSVTRVQEAATHDLEEDWLRAHAGALAIYVRMRNVGGVQQLIRDPVLLDLAARDETVADQVGEACRWLEWATAVEAEHSPGHLLVHDDPDWLLVERFRVGFRALQQANEQRAVAITAA